jgi:hypothetical protein
MNKQELHSAFGNVADLESYLTGTPMNHMTQAQQDTLHHMLDRLEDSYSQRVVSAAHQASAGLADSQSEGRKGVVNNALSTIEQNAKTNPYKVNKDQSSMNDRVRVIDPKGVTRLIPKDQVNAALQAGGKLEQ